MVRSPRTQQVLLGALALLLVVSGVAFASTAGAQVAWQQRDAVSLDATDYRVVDGDQPTVEATVEVRNPTGVSLTVQPSGVTLFENVAAQGNALSTRRSERIPAGPVTVPAGGTVTFTLVVDVPPERVERTRTAISEDRAVLSGSFLVEFKNRNFYADV